MNGDQPRTARLECAVGVALGSLPVIGGVYARGQYRLLISADAAWILSSLLVGRMSPISRFVPALVSKPELIEANAKLEDALNDDVMVADHLDGVPLSGYHGGPARLVSPSQYGYKSTKHLSAIELHTAEPSESHANLVISLGLRLVKQHPRARVAAKERHRYLPVWAVRMALLQRHPSSGRLPQRARSSAQRRAYRITRLTNPRRGAGLEGIDASERASRVKGQPREAVELWS